MDSINQKTIHTMNRILALFFLVVSIPNIQACNSASNTSTGLASIDPSLSMNAQMVYDWDSELIVESSTCTGDYSGLDGLKVGDSTDHTIRVTESDCSIPGATAWSTISQTCTQGDQASFLEITETRDHGGCVRPVTLEIYIELSEDGDRIEGTYNTSLGISGSCSAYYTDTLPCQVSGRVVSSERR